MTSSDANVQHELDLTKQKNEVLAQQVELVERSNEMLRRQLKDAQDAIDQLEKRVEAIRRAADTQVQFAEKLAEQKHALASEPPIFERRGVPDLEARALEARAEASRTQG